MHANALVVMAKAPLPGKVKTRLIPALSPEEAAEFSRCLLADILEELPLFGEADLFVAFTPDGSAPLFRKMAPLDFACFAQRGRDLGERMKNGLQDLFARGYRRVALIGGDLPGLPTRYLEEAFRTLERDGTDVVLGPSRDGGYYLIGMSWPITEIFRDIPWGGERVLSTTTQRLASIGLQPYFLPFWFDVDTLDDLRYLMSIADQTPGHFQKNTLSFLNKFRSRGIQL